MNLNFEISLTDIGIGLELSGNSESERQEVMDFLVHVDEAMDDMHFTRDLIYRLTLSVAEESEVTGWDQVTIPDGFGDKRVSFAQLYEGLSYMSEDKLITLMANAMMVKRDRDAESQARAGEEAARRTEELEKEAAEGRRVRCACVVTS